MCLRFLVLAAVFSTCRCQFVEFCPNIINEIKPCAADHINIISELFSNASSVLSYQTSKSVLGTVCTHLPQVQDFIRCFYTKYTQCIPAEWTKILPGTENVVDSIAYICDNANDIDLPCAVDNSQDLSTCVSSALDELTQGLATAGDIIRNICKLFPKFETCYGTFLSDCGGRTSEVFAEFTRYQIPPACKAPIV